MKKFVKGLEDVADIAQEQMKARGLKNCALSIIIYPSGSYISCYDVETGKYDFYRERLECMHTWRDVTEERNQLREAIERENEIPFCDPFEPLNVEDDLK